MSNCPIGSHILGFTGAAGPNTGITITAGSTCSQGVGGNLFITAGPSYGKSSNFGAGPTGPGGPYGPLRLSYNKTTMQICWNEIVIDGDVKDAAMALAKLVFDLNDGSISTSWEGILKANHGNGDFSLEYLLKNRPIFFNELNEQFERICKLKAFM